MQKFTQRHLIFFILSCFLLLTSLSVSLAATQEAKLLANDGLPNDEFGFAVAIDGNRAVVGSVTDDGLGIDSGSAYIFEFDGSTWTESAKLVASDETASDIFGHTVSLDGNRVLIGAYENTSGRGAAYVFDFDGSTWTETAKLTASDGVIGDQFGISISLDGNRALIGARANDDAGVNSGSAYIFDFDGSTWTETVKLVASDAFAFDYFGTSVSLDGDRALIGANEDDDNGNESGSAYIFAFDGSSWSETDKLTASDGHNADFFGRSVALGSNRAVIGAYADDDKGIDSGSAYIFDFDGSSWSETDKLTASDGDTDDKFGYSVSLYGSRVLIGAYLDDDNGVDSGSAYVFDFDGSSWSQTEKIIPIDGDDGDIFGRGVALDGNTALIGAYLDDDKGSDSGSAYIFDVTPDQACDITFSPATVYEGDSFTVTLGCNTLAADAYGIQTGHDASGLLTTTDTAYAYGAFANTTGFSEFQNVYSNLSGGTFTGYLQGQATGVTAPFSIASIPYTTYIGQTADSVANFNYTQLIVGDIDGAELVGSVPLGNLFSITILYKLSLDLSVDSDAIFAPNILGAQATVDADSFGPQNIVPGTQVLSFTDEFESSTPTVSADATGYLSCTSSLALPASLNNQTVTLTAGDANDDDTIDAGDVTAIITNYGTAASGDVNGDATVNILDLIHVGRNFGQTAGTCIVN